MNNNNTNPTPNPLPYKGGENNDESTPLPSARVLLACYRRDARRGGVGGGVCNFSYIEDFDSKSREINTESPLSDGRG